MNFSFSLNFKHKFHPAQKLAQLEPWNEVLCYNLQVEIFGLTTDFL